MHVLEPGNIVHSRVNYNPLQTSSACDLVSQLCKETHEIIWGIMLRYADEQGPGLNR